MEIFWSKVMNSYIFLYGGDVSDTKIIVSFCIFKLILTGDPNQS